MTFLFRLLLLKEESKTGRWNLSLGFEETLCCCIGLLFRLFLMKTMLYSCTDQVVLLKGFCPVACFLAPFSVTFGVLYLVLCIPMHSNLLATVLY